MKNNEELARIKVNELIRSGVEAQRLQRALAERRQERKAVGQELVKSPSQQERVRRQPFLQALVFALFGWFRMV